MYTKCIWTTFLITYFMQLYLDQWFEVNFNNISKIRIVERMGWINLDPLPFIMLFNSHIYCKFIQFLQVYLNVSWQGLGDGHISYLMRIIQAIYQVGMSARQIRATEEKDRSLLSVQQAPHWLHFAFTFNEEKQ